jgi:tetratricopeptide (TPR) repeat protein
MFGKKKDEKKKVWKAVPGALPSGKKDAEYWHDLVTHYNDLIQTKEEEETLEESEEAEGEEYKRRKKKVIGSSVFWAHFNLAMAHDCRGRHESAIPHYEKALDSRPDSIGLRYRLGVLLALVREEEEKKKAGKRRRGEERVERVEREREEDDEKEEKEEVPASQRHFRKVVTDDPTHSGALYEIASYEQERGR